MVNEHDINDMCPLYELPKGSKFIIAPDETVKIPPSSLSFNIEDVFTFSYIDGMYSKCTDSKGAIHHFAAWTNVLKIED